MTQNFRRTLFIIYLTLSRFVIVHICILWDLCVQLPTWILFDIFTAGYVKRSLKLRCNDCIDFITAEPEKAIRDETTLISIKNRGGLTIPNTPMLRLCKAAEQCIRWSLQVLDSAAIKRVQAHTLTYTLLNNIHLDFKCASHATELIKTIIQRYTIIRIKYEASKLDPKQDNMRQKLNRLVVFSHV